MLRHLLIGGASCVAMHGACCVASFTKSCTGKRSMPETKEEVAHETDVPVRDAFPSRWGDCWGGVL